MHTNNDLKQASTITIAITIISTIICIIIISIIISTIIRNIARTSLMHSQTRPPLQIPGVRSPKQECWVFRAMGVPGCIGGGEHAFIVIKAL